MASWMSLSRMIKPGISCSRMSKDAGLLRSELIVTALGGETFPLYLNSGHGLFESATYPSGVGFQTLRMSGWGVGAYDFDNDGHKDLFTADSHVSENADLYG